MNYITPSSTESCYLFTTALPQGESANPLAVKVNETSKSIFSRIKELFSTPSEKTPAIPVGKTVFLVITSTGYRALLPGELGKTVSLKLDGKQKKILANTFASSPEIRSLLKNETTDVRILREELKLPNSTKLQSPGKVLEAWTKAHKKIARRFTPKLASIPEDEKLSPPAQTAQKTATTFDRFKQTIRSIFA